MIDATRRNRLCSKNAAVSLSLDLKSVEATPRKTMHAAEQQGAPDVDSASNVRVADAEDASESGAAAQ